MSEFTSRQLHREYLRPWAKAHHERYPQIKPLPYLPWLFPDQKVERGGRGLSIASCLPETAYTKLHRKAYAKSVGSAALAEQIIESFHTTPAFAQDPGQSIADYTVEALESGSGVVVSTAHLDRLSDIADFTDGLNLAIAEEHGLKYADRFKVVVNKLMTAERLGLMPMAWLISIGLQPRWGMPANGANKRSVPTAAQEKINRRLAEKLYEEQKTSGQAVGMVLGGSAATLKRDMDGKVGQIELPKVAEVSAKLLLRYGGVIIANRLGEEFRVGSVEPVQKPAKKVERDAYAKRLANTVYLVTAAQASEMSGGIPVVYPSLLKDGDTVTVAARQHETSEEL